MGMVESAQREPARTPEFFGQSLAPRSVSSVNQLHQELLVRVSTFEVPVPTQHQLLIHRRLESMMTLLDVAVLMRFARLRVRRPKTVVIQQPLIAGCKLIPILQVVDRRRQAVAPMFFRHPPRCHNAFCSLADRLSNDSENTG